MSGMISHCSCYGSQADELSRHSFGSIQSFALSVAFPNLSDCLVLTGFSVNQSFVPQFTAGGNLAVARLSQHRLGNSTPGALNYPNGYLVTGDITANLYNFLLPGYFDECLLQFADANKQPATVGEFLTLGNGPQISPFTGPVLVITGSDDVPFCGGDCLNTGDPKVPSVIATVKQGFPKLAVDKFLAYVQPNAAHGINIHYNATGAYDVINTFIKGKVG